MMRWILFGLFVGLAILARYLWQEEVVARQVSAAVVQQVEFGRGTQLRTEPRGRAVLFALERMLIERDQNDTDDAIGIELDDLAGEVPQNENLEALLDAESANEEWTREVSSSVELVLEDDPSIEVSMAKCISDFCRVVLKRPLDSKLDWFEVDSRIVDVASGMTWMRASPDGNGNSSAYVYFRQDDGDLPL